MIELLEGLTSLVVLVFVVTCMVTAGLGLNVRDIVAPLRQPQFVLLAVLTNFILAPAIAIVLTQIVPLHPPYAIGLLLLGGVAGAPFLPKLAVLAKGDIACSVGLVMILMVGSVVFMPLALPLMIPGLSADPWALLRPLLFTMLLPLAIGVVVNVRSSTWSGRLRPVFARISNVSMVLTIVLLITLRFRSLMGTIGTGAIAAGLVFVLLSLVVGYVLGGSEPGKRSIMSLGTGQRNIAAALLIATESFAQEPGVAVMLVVTTLTGLVLLVLAARRFASQTSSRSETLLPATNGPNLAIAPSASRKRFEATSAPGLVEPDLNDPEGRGD